MRYSNAEDYALLLLLPCAMGIVGALSEQPAKPLQIAAPHIALPALTVEEQRPQYAMTVTAKRLPAACREGGKMQGSSMCETFVAQAPRVESGPLDTQVAAAGTVVVAQTYLGACKVIDRAVAANAMSQDQANVLIRSLAAEIDLRPGDKERIVADLNRQSAAASPCKVALRAL
jgi:hypothetical protein